MPPTLTVCVCTHNPRSDFLRRTLAGLQQQTLPPGQWEFLLVDNASKVPLAAHWDLSWHPRARHVREEELGLTAARLRGIRESASELLLFVDDDNILAPDYLVALLNVAAEYPRLGCLGAGDLAPEFEREPAPVLRSYTAGLALRTLPAPRWSNSMSDGMIPCGAGLAVRRRVAEQFVHAVSGCAIRKKLGRNGASLSSGEDDEFSWVACELGLGKGVFPELKITHLIDQRRVEKAYLLSITRGHGYSHEFLNYIHGQPDAAQMPPSTFQDILVSFCHGRIYPTLRHVKSWLAGFRRTAIEKDFDVARRAGIDQARKELAKLKSSEN